jgi:hypothetical protein
VLKDAGIELAGKLALANYGGIYRGTKVKNAQDNGMAGCIIFTDPQDDGEITEENGYEAYPSKSSYLSLLMVMTDEVKMVRQETRPPFNEAVSAFPLSTLEIQRLSVGPPHRTHHVAT